MTTSFRSLLEAIRATQTKYQVIAVTNLKTGARTFNLYVRGRARHDPPVATGLPSHEDAVALGRKLSREIKR